MRIRLACVNRNLKPAKLPARLSAALAQTSKSVG
jgi:hypothetical protein